MFSLFPLYSEMGLNLVSVQIFHGVFMCPVTNWIKLLFTYQKYQNVLKTRKKHALFRTCLDNQSWRETADLNSAYISQIYDKNLTNVRLDTSHTSSTKIALHCCFGRKLFVLDMFWYKGNYALERNREKCVNTQKKRKYDF